MVLQSHLGRSALRQRRSLLTRATAGRFSGMEQLEGRRLFAGNIEGTVYDDLNDNGVHDNGENGIPGWTVFVDLNTDGSLSAGEPSAVTDNDGDYLIQGITAGARTVKVIFPAAWRPSTGTSDSTTVNVVNGQDARVDFFAYQAHVGSIEGVVWQDTDGDGIRGVNPVTGQFTDPGLSGWTIFLDTDNNGAPDPGEITTTTDATGNYTFVDLSPGDYEVTEVMEPGWEIVGGFDLRQTVRVRDGEVTRARDIANFTNLDGSITGVVWNDANRDGLRATDPATGEFIEAGLEGWTIFLDLDQNGIPDLSEPATVTDATGHYLFTGIVAGDYEVTEVLPEGWFVSTTFNIHETVTVSGGLLSTAPDFANYSNSNGSIRGFMWSDVNNNGLRDLIPGTPDFADPPLTGWSVYLDLNGNGVLDLGEPTTTTDPDGLYLFPDLPVGDYDVVELLQSGWEPAFGFDDNFVVAVGGGVVEIAPDFANHFIATVIPGTVAGVVWNDVNGNGVRDIDPVTTLFADPGLAGWSVYVDSNNNRILDAGENSSTTDANGAYSLTNLSPGSVTVVLELPATWRSSNPVTNAVSVTVTNGALIGGQDFGVLQVFEGAISGTVYEDLNRNGTQDAGELGISGVGVYLDLNDNGTREPAEPTSTTTTDLFYTPGLDEAGNYSFTHLDARTYKVRVSLPAALSATPETERVRTVTLAPGEHRSGVNFGAVYRANEIGGKIFHDPNNNFVQDVGEAGVPGAIAYIDLDRDAILDPGEPSAFTDINGVYNFQVLTPGNYVLRAIFPPGYECNRPHAATGGILLPTGVSNPAVGIVTPASDTFTLASGQTHRQTYSITLPTGGALTNLVDVFLLFDDTGSFTFNSPIVRSAFPSIITQLQGALPGIDLAFGVGRFEEYGNFAYENATGRPFILNQPMVAASTTGYMAAIQAALNRTTPGYGGDGPETDIEALYQLVTGLGFDGNNNGSVLDSGRAGPAATQLTPGTSGDVPSFASFLADLANNVMAPSGSIGGAGFRSGALPIILTATDIGFAYQPRGETMLSGVGGVTLPVSALTQASRPTTPFGAGAGLQQTITALNALGALVIGLGTNPEPLFDPRQALEALSKLTGAVNRSAGIIANGTLDPIAPGDPFYFQIASGFGTSVADGIVSAIRNAVSNVAIDITVQASDPRVRITNYSGTRLGVGSGSTATFDVEFTGDGAPRRFDLQFVRAGTDVVLGSIPIVIGTPIAGDCYNFIEVEHGQIEGNSDFSTRTVVAAPAQIAARMLAYNNSSFDGNSALISLFDDAAIATDKQALLPGSSASFFNYTSYSRGLNGLMIDLDRSNLAISASDLEFRVGNTMDPATWSLAPSPVSVSVRYGVGVGGANRVHVLFADGAIRNQWLQVSVKANANTRLAVPDVFYFGNQVGETGDASGLNAHVDATDLARVQANPRNFRNPAPVTDLYDINRDRRVDAVDLALVRDNFASGPNALIMFITLPGALTGPSLPPEPKPRDPSSNGTRPPSSAMPPPGSPAMRQFLGAPVFNPARLFSPIEIPYGVQDVDVLLGRARARLR